MASTRRQSIEPIVLQMIEEAYQIPNWNATHLRAALQRVKADCAGWRPEFAKRSIADITVHCAYWKYALRRFLTGAERGGFAFPGSNWFRTETPLTDTTWREYRKLLQDEHEQLCLVFKEGQLKLSHAKPRTGRWTSLQRAFWLAIHDGYHTGQINLIRAMYARAMKK